MLKTKNGYTCLALAVFQKKVKNCTCASTDINTEINYLS